GNATFTVTLTGNIQDALTVDYASADGTAMQPGDYTTSAGTVTFPAGSVSGATQTITVPIINDLVSEPTETYTVNLSNIISTGSASKSDASGLGTILDDDAVTLALSGFTVTEINGTQTENFVVTLNIPAQEDIVITFTTANVTATSGSDYTGQTTVSYTIPAGSTTFNIPVDILGDLISEPTETFTGTIAISNANGQNVSIATGIATATILDDDIIAIDDAGSSVNGYTGGIAVVNVLLNDQIYGSFPTISNVILSQVNSLDPNGIPTSNVLLNADGSVTINAGTPAGNYMLTYQICEMLNPDNCDQAVVTILVVAPVIDAVDDAGTVNGMDGGTADSNVLANDQLNEAPVIPSDVTLVVVTPASDPGIVLNTATGEVTVAPGTPSGIYTIVYHICEILNPSTCDQAVVTITVTSALIEANDDAGTISGINGGIAVADILTNDLLNGNPITLSDITIGFISSTNPGVTLVGDSVVVSPGTPAGTYYLLYQICEVLNPSNCDQATVTVTVTNDPPSVTGLTTSMPEDTPITICLPINDPDAGSIFTASICGNAVNGILSAPVVSGNQVCVTYTPNLNYNGTEAFCIEVCDNGSPALCDTALITINVIPVEDLPVITGITTSTPEDTPIAVCLPITDPDAGSVFTASVCSAAINGTLSVPVVTGNQVCITYTPNLNYNGAEPFCIQVCDNGSPVLCDTALITINVIPVNDAPVVINEFETTCNNSVINGNVLVNGDNDPDGTALTIVTTPVSGPVNGNFTILSNGDYTYSPSATFSGIEQIIVSVCDNGIPLPSSCIKDTISITVVPAVFATAGADLSTCENTPILIGSASAQNAGSVHWTTSGTGVFDDPALVNPTYSPDMADVTGGSVKLTMHTTGLAPCGDYTDELTLVFSPAPTADAGSDATTCSSSLYTLNNASANHYASLVWKFSPADAGTLSDTTVLNPVFTPSFTFTGDVTFTLKAIGLAACGAEVYEDDMILTVIQGVIVNAGSDKEITAGSITMLHGSVSGGTGPYAWSWEPSALLQSNIVPEPVSLPINQPSLFTLTVLDMTSGCSSQDQVLVSTPLANNRPVANDDYDTTGLNASTLVNILHNDIDPIGLGLNVSIIGNP
ncbi:MAG: Ig-like domain-containing protein, partial [Lentimicrobiaceae bacterium]